MAEILKKTCEDTPRAKPRRGYHDMETKVTFKDGTEEEQRVVMAGIYEELKANHYMWLYAPCKVGDNVWTINHGYDSGD